MVLRDQQDLEDPDHNCSGILCIRYCFIHMPAAGRSYHNSDQSLYTASSQRLYTAVIYLWSSWG